MTNPQSKQDEVDLFKNWIRKRFIAECDFESLPPLEALAWSAALREMSETLTHAIVPFQRRRKS
ncbi:MAG: hypothetical protein ACR2LR_03300 [Hassallia sp.]